MPSQRRIKVFGLMVLLTVLITLYMTSSARSTQNSDFYTKTSDALVAKDLAEKAAAEKIDADDVGARLKAAEDAAKKAADVKGQKLLSEEDEGRGEKSVAGRVLMKEQEEEKEESERVVDIPHTAEETAKKVVKAKQEPETKEDHEVEVELNAILKKSPIIIFSKSFCPFSRKAKTILLQQYKIVPPPYVVELDKHPLGPALQAALAKSTGRHTVPNVLINGRSIGGGDDVEALHQKGKLDSTIRSMGGRRIVEVTKIEVKSKEEVKR
ncbi:glutaredoxin [Mytilinidion resinicola]|uniref:Glutaredoxin n=1 Tax=Mytilinidion resinicola TaxID=574789 RepID=A0A6A6Z3Z8_9PEZI|nr:glutaredoxin [Mytilinidion resinicola]KAF2815760.1 glutaredoxin [Mytilinidion resinicola]